MPDVSFVNLLVVVAVAVLAPLTVGYLPRLRVPAVVLEIVGRHHHRPVRARLGTRRPAGARSLPCSAWRSCSSWPGWRSTCTGCAAAAPLRVLGYLVTLVLGSRAGVALHAQSAGSSQPAAARRSPSRPPRSAWSCRCSRTPARLDSQVGQTAGRGGRSPTSRAIVLLSLFFSSSGGSTGSKVVLLGAFAGLVAVVTALVVSRRRPVRCGWAQVLVRLQDTTAEIRVRGAVLLLVGVHGAGRAVRPGEHPRRVPGRGDRRPGRP